VLLTDSLAVNTCAPHAGEHPFDDQRALQLGDRTDDHDDGAVQWTAGINVFTEADVFDSCPIQLVEYIEEVFYRADDAI